MGPNVETNLYSTWNIQSYYNPHTLSLKKCFRQTPCTRTLQFAKCLSCPLFSCKNHKWKLVFKNINCFLTKEIEKKFKLPILIEIKFIRDGSHMQGKMLCLLLYLLDTWGLFMTSYTWTQWQLAHSYNGGERWYYGRYNLSVSKCHLIVIS